MLAARLADVNEKLGRGVPGAADYARGDADAAALAERCGDPDALLGAEYSGHHA